MNVLRQRWDMVVKRNSENVAVIEEHRKFTYLEMDWLIKKYELLIREHGIPTNIPIGVSVCSSADYWAIVMAILSHECFFVPIDENIPTERVKKMLSASGVKYIFCNNNLNDVDYPEYNIINIDNMTYDSIISNEINGEECKNAYVLFTSGTSGFPKGVVVTKEALLNLVCWFGERYNIDNQTKLLQLANISFDVSIEEYFGILLNGGIVVIPDEKCRYNSRLFADSVNVYGITMVQMIPRMAKALIVENAKLLSLKEIIVGAEQLDEETKNLVLKKGYRLFNHYGPTECTVDALVTECFCDDSVSIGTPINNMYCYIMGDNGEKIDDYGQIGELIVEGIGVADGYINNDEETNRFFFYNAETGRRSYRTGDLVKKNEKGQYIFIGRKDNQIKINGKRIEIEDIYSVAKQIPEIEECLVWVMEEEANKIISMFWTGGSCKEDIIGCFKKNMPNFMIPNAFIHVSSIPLNINGKVDYERLKQAYEEDGNASGKELTSKMMDVLKAFCSITGRTMEEMKSKLNFSFENLGIDSLTFMQIIIDVEEKSGKELNDEFLLPSEFENVFEFIEKIGNYLQGDKE